MIIGISGYSRSGKDLSGTTLQWLLSNTKMSYKDWTEVSEFSGSHLSFSQMYLLKPDAYLIKKFGYKLKQIAGLLLNEKVEKFEDESFKKSLMDPMWAKEVHHYVGGVYDHSAVTTPTIREFLQSMGVEAMRNRIHPRIWEYALFNDYKDGDNWIITDPRFQNEIDAIKNRGGITIRLHRPGLSVMPHSSETTIDKIDFDYHVHNDSTHENLTEELRTILKTEGLL